MSGMRSKSSFFRSLELLDCSDDSPDDEDSLEQLLARARPAETSNLTVASSSAEPLTLTRANTAPSPSYTDKELQEVVVGHDAHHRRRPQPAESNLRTVKRSQTTTGTMPSIMTGIKRGGGPVSKKRRTNGIIKLVPEEQRIFKELVFCKRFRNFGLSHFALSNVFSQSFSQITISLHLADSASSERGNMVLTGRWTGQKVSRMWSWTMICSIRMSSNILSSNHSPSVTSPMSPKASC